MPDPTYNHLTLRGPRPVRDRFFADVDGVADRDVLRVHVPATDDEARERWGAPVVCDVHRRHGDDTTELWFDTWSGLPDLWFEAVASQFPSLEIRLEFVSPGNCYEGHMTARDGEVGEQVMGMFDYEAGRDDSEDFPSLEEAGALRGPEDSGA